MGIEHVEVALRDRNVAGLAGHEAAVMQSGQVLRQLHQLLEIVERAIAPPALQIAHEGRPINRSENLVASTDAHAARRGPHAGLFHVRPGFAPDAQRLLILPELDADLLHQPIGMLLQPNKAFLVEEIDVPDRALDVGSHRSGIMVRSVSATANATTANATTAPDATPGAPPAPPLASGHAGNPPCPLSGLTCTS